ncbi:MAG: hypothetical protein ABH846_02610, partial [Patescibacteria group bacterium]
MSDKLLRLASALKAPSGISAGAGEEVIEVSGPASTAATVYEKLRRTIDYQEEHLLRRNAILRMLKRFMGSDMPLEKMAANLLQELVWARYLPNKEVPTRFVSVLTPIINKYEPLLRAADEIGHDRDYLFTWILDVLSTEIEYAIAPPVGDEALVSYMYEEMRERIYWDPKIIISEEERDLKIYIAIHQTILKSNLATLRFRVLTLYYPDWPGASTAERVKEVAENVDAIIRTVDSQINHPVTNKLGLLLRRKAGVFHVVRDAIAENPDQLPNWLNEPEVLDREVTKALKKRTKIFRIRIRRTAIRAVIFLFLTKMLLALIIEVPYDFFIVKETHLTPLFINIFFHPLFLAFLSLTTSIPEKRNVVDYHGAVRALAVGADHDYLNIRMKREIFGTWSKVFAVVYSMIFLFTYGAIGVLLTRIGFNWLSITLFLFFLSLVTFFGIRIRSTVKDIVLSDVRKGIIGPIFDIFMLPIVRAGRWLSTRVAKINVFIYFFDFIIEAPLKVAVRF